MNNDAPEGTCYICGHGNPDVIQEHHIIPRRYDGCDASWNIVDLCPSCHDALERIYDDRFYEELGVEKPSRESHDRECDWDTCTSRETYRLTSDGVTAYLCEGHRKCRKSGCGKIGTPTPAAKGGHSVLCNEHRECRHSECYSKAVQVYTTEYAGTFIYCPLHARENMFVRDEFKPTSSKTQRDLCRDIREHVRENQGTDQRRGAAIDDIVEALEETYVPAAVEDEISKLCNRAELYKTVGGADELRVV